MSNGPLDGIRVIDFCWVGAGPYATKMLADLGADVIKVESAVKPDGLRLSPPFAGGQIGVNRSGYFSDRNTSKRSVAINMNTAEGKRLAQQLVAGCDVVANSFTPGVMARFGLSYDEVRASNPQLIYLAMSMQGDSGPERDYLGYGMTISALVGIHHLSALPGKLPVGTGTNYPDHIPNPCHAVFAVLAALRHRRRTGEGQYIDIAQTESTIAVLAPALVEYEANGHDREPIGNRHERFAPHGVYACAGKDRWIAIAVTDDAQYPDLVTALGLPTDVVPRDADEAYRRAAADYLDEAIGSRTRDRDADELMHLLQARGIPAGVVHDAQGVIELDEQLTARGHWVRLVHAEMGETIYNAWPFRLSTTSTDLRAPAPLLGEHTEEICRDVLGIDEDRIESLVRAGVLT